MLFRTFDGQLMMVLHRPFRRARARLFDMEDTGDNLKILRSRHDLDGQLCSAVVALLHGGDFRPKTRVGS